MTSNQSNYVEYSVRYTGSLVVKTIEFKQNEIDKKHWLDEVLHAPIIDYVKRDLKNYFPNYYRADIFAPDGWHGHLKAEVEVRVLES